MAMAEAGNKRTARIPARHDHVALVLQGGGALGAYQAGQRDLRDTLTHPEWLKSSGVDEGVTQYDLVRHTRPV